MLKQKQSRNINYISVFFVVSFFLLIFASGLLLSKPFNIIKEAVAVGGTSVGQVNLNTAGTTFTPGGVWKSDGSVGIGTTNPGTKFDVTGTGRFSSTLTATNGFALSAGTLSLPANSITDAMVSDTLTSSLATTATTLQTARTIWGQSFNGSANVSGALSGATTGSFSSTVTGSQFNGSGAGLTGTAASLTAGAVTNGVYTTSALRWPINTWMYSSGAGTRNWHIGAADMYWEIGGAGSFHFRNSADADVATISNTGVVTAPTFAGNATTATYATNATKLYASDAPYTYGSASPYYMYVTYDGSRWLLQASPASPAAVRVAYADSAGNADMVDGYHYNNLPYTPLGPDTGNTYGTTRLYRRESNSDYSVQTYWTGSYWHLDGYNGGTLHAGVQVAYADSAGNADTVDSIHATSFFQYEGFSLDANAMGTNRSGFTYSVNAPYTGPIARFSAGTSYDLEINAQYSGGGSGMAIRTRNGDAGAWNAWYSLIHSGNIASQSVANASYLADTNGVAWIHSTNGTLLYGASNSVAVYYAAVTPWAGITGKPVFATAGSSGRVRMYDVGCAGSWGTSCDANTDGYADYADALVSDARLKTVVKPVTNVMDKIMKLQGVYYQWNDKYKALGLPIHGSQEIGFIAQEVQSLFPELVFHEGSNDPYFHLDYSKLTAVLAEGIKEQQTQIVSLQSITTDFINNFKAGLIETKKLVVDGVDILKKLNELSDRSDKQQKTIDAQQKQIEELQKIVKELKK